MVDVLFVGSEAADLVAILDTDDGRLYVSQNGTSIEVTVDWMDLAANSDKVARVLHRLATGPHRVQVVIMCLAMGSEQQHLAARMEEAEEELRVRYGTVGINRFLDLVHVFLIAPGCQVDYGRIASDEDLPERGTVVDRTRESLLSALTVAIAASSSEETPRRAGSPTVHLPAELEALLSSDYSVLNPLVPGDLLAVLRDQVASAAKGLVGGIPWNEDMAQKLIERLSAAANDVTDTPLNEREAQATVQALVDHLPVSLSFSGWSSSIEPPTRVPPSKHIGYQPLRWLSFLPNQFHAAQEGARELLLLLNAKLSKPLPVALRLHALSIYSVVDLHHYCLRHGILADEETLTGFVTLICTHEPDQEDFMVLCAHLAVEGYRQATRDERNPPSSASSSRGGGEPAAAMGAAMGITQQWCMGCKAMITAMNMPFIGRRTECTLLVLGLVSGSNVFIHGPPGVAKSMLARRLFPYFKSDGAGQPFKIVLSRTTLPDELFGSVSVTAAKQDRFERNTTGHLPSASLAFIDEVWNASSAVLNGLLSIINEGVFRNGTEEVKVPLEMVIAASTDYPTAPLAPFYDRFLVRMDIKRLSTDEQWEAMLSARWKDPLSRNDPVVPDSQMLTDSILRDLQRRAQSVGPSARVLHFLKILPRVIGSICALKNLRHVDISERRLATAFDTLQVAAVVRSLANGSDKPMVNLLDLALLQHMLWETPRDNVVLEAACLEALRSTLKDYPLDSEKEYFRAAWAGTPWQWAINCSGSAGYLGRAVLKELGIGPRVCRHCRKSNPADDSSFCGSCGEQLPPV